MNEKIINYIEKFFRDLEIDIQSLDIKNEEENFYFVKLNSEDSSLLIWIHWTTIESLQRVLSMCVNNFSEDKIKLKLEINDYCKTYEDRLFARVDKSIIALKNNWGEYELWNLSPYDRKKIHTYVAKNYSDIISKSRGSWDDRKLFLLLDKSNKKPKTKLTIDIDWNWI